MTGGPLTQRVRSQWVRPPQSPLDVGAETLNQRKEGTREWVGQRGEEGLGKRGQAQEGSPEDLVPCSLCPRNAKERSLQRQEGSMPVGGAAPKGSACLPAPPPGAQTSCELVSSFVCFPSLRLFWSIRAAYASPWERENKHHRGDKLT